MVFQIVYYKQQLNDCSMFLSPYISCKMSYASFLFLLQLFGLTTLRISIFDNTYQNYQGLASFHIQNERLLPLQQQFPLPVSVE